MAIIDSLVQWLTQPLVIISAVFWIVAFVLAKILGKKKDRVTIAFPFLVLIRWKVFNQFFKKIASKHKKFWRIWFNIGAIVSYLLMLGALYFIIANFVQLLLDPKPENAILPLIPGVTISLPVFSFLLLPILINLTFHEFSHAIAAEVDGVNVKSSGIMGAGIFAIIGFGAFVEVDDFQMYNRDVSWKTRVRTYSGGIWSNVIISGIFLGLLFLTPALTNLGYENTTFRVESVLTSAEGGFNEGNIEVGDIAYSINGTRLDYENGYTLDAFLGNETDVKFAIGDDVLVTCITPKTGEFYNRTITLGHRSYVGFTYEQISNSAFEITGVMSHEEGGNNGQLSDKVENGLEIHKINGQPLDYENGKTFDWFLTQTRPPYTMNLTTADNENLTINVDYMPLAAGAFLFEDVYLGILVERNEENQVIITEVLQNATEYGINEGHIPENTVITHVNGLEIELGAEQTFPEWMRANFNLTQGDQISLKAANGTNYTLLVGEIPVRSVYIGIMSEPYALPKNWLGKLFGGAFPSTFNRFVSLTLTVGISLALFNLLPTAIFDGGRMLKEIIEKIIGVQEKLDATKKLHYHFNPEEPEQHLMTHNITNILSMHRLEKLEDHISTDKPPKGKINPDHYSLIPVEYEPIDEYGNGYIEKIRPITEENIPSNTLFQVEVKYLEDLKAPLKRKIYRGISWFVGGIVLASFVVSFIKFGNTLFWL